MGGERGNIAEIASRISKDIFKSFGWHRHPRSDENFSCVIDEHGKGGGSPRGTHPTDVVFSYKDPYLGKDVHLLTDLKSYAKDTITHSKLRSAIKSLVATVECAKSSSEWRTKFAIDEQSDHEVRGMLFVHNHDNGYEKNFYEALEKVNVQTLPIKPPEIIHFLGPRDIQRLYTTANDIKRLKGEAELPEDYTFYYPDLVMRMRRGDQWDQTATFETLCGPFIIIRHKEAKETASGFLIYYNRPGDCSEEFEYLLSCFARFQMLESEERIRIRVTDPAANSDLKSHFDLAIKRCVRAWGFDDAREKTLRRIEVERLPAIVANYNPGDMGWE